MCVCVGGGGDQTHPKNPWKILIRGGGGTPITSIYIHMNAPPPPIDATCLVLLGETHGKYISKILLSSAIDCVVTRKRKDMTFFLTYIIDIYAHLWIESKLIKY